MRLSLGRLEAWFHRGIAFVPLVFLVPAHAQVVTDDAGGEPPRARVTLTYQYSETNDLATDVRTIRTGPSYAQALDLNFDLAIKERWSLTAGLPLIAKRFKAPSHNPLAIDPPHPESKFIDDGHYHTYFQDLRLGVSYSLNTELVGVAPFILLSVPSNDYPFFAGAAVGQNRRKIEIGSSFAYRPPILRWDFDLSWGYVFVERTLGINVNHTRLDGQAAYLMGSRLSIKFLFSRKEGNGVPGSEFSPDGTERWYQHDRLVRHNYMTAGVGAEWSLNGRDQLSVVALRMVHAQDVFKLRYAFGITVSRLY